MIESEPEQFTHQNSVLLYRYLNTEDHKNQAFRYLKQYIILRDLCYDVTHFWIPPCHRNLSVVSRRSFSVNIWSARLGFISDRNDWCMSCGCIACDMYRHSSKRSLHYYLPPWPIPPTNTVLSPKIKLMVLVLVIVLIWGQDLENVYPLRKTLQTIIKTVYGNHIIGSGYGL